jgi:hypothetical protein
MTPTRPKRLGVAIVVALLVCACDPGPVPFDPDMPIDAAARRAVIAGVLTRLRTNYVNPARVSLIVRGIETRERRGVYDSLTSARAFAESLTAHLQLLSKDRHLRVQFSSPALPRSPWRRDAAREPVDSARARGRRANFGFATSERLGGNVAYLEIRSFAFDPVLAEETVAKEMTRVADADALIIDVRRNGGGSPRLAALVSSYLFGPDSVHLSTLRWRRGGRVERMYTRNAVSGKRFGPDKPIFIVTARRTFSAAEAFAYGLKVRNRAQVVGDTTGGGAYVGGLHRVTDHFGVWVSAGRPESPVTGTNWERVGIPPDIYAPAAHAVRTAHREALLTLLAREEDPERYAELVRIAEDLRDPEELVVRGGGGTPSP